MGFHVFLQFIFFVFIHRCVILSCTCVLLVSIAVLLHVSILAVLLAFYMCSFWYYCCLFTGIPFGSIAVLLQVSFFLAVSQSFYSLFTGVLFGSIAVFLYVIFVSITIFLQVYFLEVSLSWKTFVTCQVVS